MGVWRAVVEKRILLPQAGRGLGEKGLVAGGGEVVAHHAREVGRLGAIVDGDVVRRVALARDQPEHVADVVLRDGGVAVAEQAEIRELGVPVEKNVEVALPVDAGRRVGKGQVHAAETRAGSSR